MTVPIWHTFVFRTPGAHIWTAPSDVATVGFVGCWGGGGAGAAGSVAGGGHGGGGGGAAFRTFTPVPQQDYPLYVGAGGIPDTTQDGETSWFQSSSFCAAGGGQNATATAAGAPGGLLAGDFGYTGHAGGTATSTNGGFGGGAAGRYETNTQSHYAPAGGGWGGEPVWMSTPGQSGQPFGGGGGGGGPNSTVGGAGAPGGIVVRVRRHQTTAHGHLRSADGTRDNLIVWRGFDVLSVRRRYETNVRLTNQGNRANARFVFNVRPHQTTPHLQVYYAAEIDYDRQVVLISRFNGYLRQTVLEQPAAGIQLNTWYRWIVEVRPGFTAGTTRITTRVQDPVGSFDLTVGPVVVSNYAPSTGDPGFGADEAISEFAYLYVEEIV